MKKFLKNALAMLLLAALLLSLAACGGSGGGQTASTSPAVGTWIGQYTKFVADSDDARNIEEFSLELKADGTGVHHRDDMDFDVKWKLDGENFTMDEKFIGDPIVYTGTLKGDDLSIFNGDPEDIWTCQYVYVREGGTSAASEPAPAQEPAGTDAPEKAEAASAKYSLYEYEVEGNKVSNDMLEASEIGETYLLLNNDGTGQFSLFDMPMDITWEDGKVIAPGNLEYPFELNGDTLTLDMQGMIFTMKLDEGAASASEPAAETKPEAPSSGTAAASGDGIVSEERLQMGYVWMSKVANDIFGTTYEELAEYFGVDGEFDKEEYDDHMQVNKRYYKWISEDNDTHFIYVNFEEEEPGVFTVSSFNSSGFTGSEAEAKYLDAVKAEAREADIAAAANMAMKDFKLDLYPWGEKEDHITLSMKIPESGWSFDESRNNLVESDDPNTFGAGFIKFQLKDDVAGFDFYKDSFENYKDIDSREIGGVTMQGRTYKNIGYEWTEYIAQIDDTHALSIGIVDVDIADGTAGDMILDSITIS